VALLLCLAFVPSPAAAQSGIKVLPESVVLTRTNYPSVKPSEGPVRIYAGEWSLTIEAHNYDVTEINNSAWALDVKARFFLDNALLCEELFWGPYWYAAGYIQVGSSSGAAPVQALSLSKPGVHEVRIEVWHGTETTPQDTYSFNVTVVEPEVSGLQASSRVVRALGDNSLAVSFTNGGNENMRQAVLSVAASGGLTITPSQVELGDVNPGEQISAGFTVSSPASVTLGTAQVRFSLSFIDYVGVSHTEDVSGTVEVYRLSPTLTLSAPSSVENSSTVEIAATLKDPGGNPIANENIALTVGGVALGVFKTDSGGVARASYRVTETGTLNVGASFSGSTSYEASSSSAQLTVTPSTMAPSSSILLLVALVALFVALGGSAVYLKRRRPKATKSARKAS
jgi:hypothetical protein